MAIGGVACKCGSHYAVREGNDKGGGAVVDVRARHTVVAWAGGGERGCVVAVAPVIGGRTGQSDGGCLTGTEGGPAMMVEEREFSLMRFSLFSISTTEVSRISLLRLGF